MKFFIPEQILEYEHHKNDSESDYEEYEIYDDSFDFAERDKAQTWNGEVNRKSELSTYNTSSEWSHLKLPVSSGSTARIYSSGSPHQVSLRGEKGQKGEPAVIEPVSC